MNKEYIKPVAYIIALKTDRSVAILSNSSTHVETGTDFINLGNSDCHDLANGSVPSHYDDWYSSNYNDDGTQKSGWLSYQKFIKNLWRSDIIDDLAFDTIWDSCST